MGTWLSAAEGFVAVAIPVVGLVYTYTTNRQAQYDRVLTLVALSGTPPITNDRHVIGTAFEPLSKLPPGQPVTLTSDEIKSLFNVLWYFQRVDAMHVSLRSALRPGGITRTQALLLDSLGPTLDVWASYVGLTLVDAAGHPVVISDTTGALQHLVGDFNRLRARRMKPERVTITGHLSATPEQAGIGKP